MRTSAKTAKTEVAADDDVQKFREFGVLLHKPRIVGDAAQRKQKSIQ